MRNSASFRGLINAEKREIALPADRGHLVVVFAQSREAGTYSNATADPGAREQHIYRSDCERCIRWCDR